MIYEFSNFELDEDRWELSAHGSPVDIPPKAMGILAWLLRHRDRVVSSEELQARLWPGVVVTNGSVRKAIRIIRLVLSNASPRSEDCIRTIRGRGYRFVGAVRQAASRASEPTSRIVLPQNDGIPLVGRRSELTELMGALRNRNETSTFMLVGGEAGIGKTRLLEAFENSAEQHGAQCVWGRCCEEGGAPELWPWIAVVRELRQRRAHELLDPHHEALIRTLCEPTEERPERLQQFAHSESIQFRLFDAIRELLCAGAREFPLVVFLEDLHAADEASLSLARFLARDPKRAPIVIIGTYRPADIPSEPNSKLRNLLSHVPSLRLEGLTHDDVRLLVETAVPSATAELVSRVFSTTEGNPLFVVELLRHLAPDVDGLTLQVPQRIAELIRGRMELLRPEVLDCLKIAAVLGRRFELAVLRAAAELDQDQLAEVLDTACDRGLVCRVPDAGSQYAFRHMLFRTVLYDDLSLSDRIRLHRRIAEVLERFFAAGSDVAAAQLAHHFSQADIGTGCAKAAQYSLTAGTQAFRSCAYEEAIGHFRRALKGLGPEPLKPDLLCDCLIRLAHALRLSGDYAQASEVFLKACSTARDLGSARRFAESALGFSQVNPELGVEANPKVIEILERAVEFLQHAPDAGEIESKELLALALSRLVLGLFLAHRESEAEELSARSLELARATERPFALLHALQSRHWVLWKPGLAEQRLAIANEMAGLERLLEDDTPLLDARVCQITNLLELGQHDLLYQRMAEYKRLAERHNDARALWQTQVMATTRALLEGDLESAAQQALFGLHDGLRIHPQNAQLYCGTQVFWAYIELGRGHEIEQSCRERLEAEPDAIWLRGALVRLYAELDDKKETENLIDSLARNGFAELPDDWTLLANLAHLAMACSVVGDAARARLIHARLAKYAGSHVVLGPAVVYLGPTSLYSGLCARCLLRFDEAIEYFQSAVASSLEIGAAPMTTRARYYYAEALLGRRRVGDVDRACRELGMARMAARQMGQIAIQRRIESLLERTTTLRVIA